MGAQSLSMPIVGFFPGSFHVFATGAQQWALARLAGLRQES